MGFFFFFFFFERQNLIPTKMYISVEIGQNLMEWLELPEIGRNLSRGGTGGITVLDCMPVQDIPAILTGTERN